MMTAMAGDEVDDPPARPGRNLLRGFVVSGTTTIGAGAAAIALGAPLLAPAVLVPSGALHLWVGAYGLRLAPGMQLLAMARDATERGELDRAAALLDRAERRYGLHRVRVGAALGRAAIALARGDDDGVVAATSRAVELADRALMKATVWVERLAALSLRALIHAKRGAEDAARADLQEAHKMLEHVGRVGGGLAFGAGHATETALGRLALAEAVLLARSGGHSALREHLEQKADVLAHVSEPRERALLAGFERLLAEEASSPYRRRDRPHDDARIEAGDWVAEALQGAESAPRAESAAGALAIAARDVASLGRTNGDAGTARRVGVVVGVWVVVALAAFTLNFLPVSPAARNPLFLLSVLLPALVFFGLIGFAASRAVGQVRRNRTLFASLVRAAAQVGEGDAAVQKHLSAPEPTSQAQTALFLARRANARGAFAEASAFAQRALDESQSWFSRVALFDEVLPALVTERALAQSALGQTEAARRELTALPTTYAYRARSIYAVSLVAALVDADRALAIRLIQERDPDLPMERPIEALTNLVRATQPGGLGLGERRRLSASLARDPGLQTWAETVAPDLLAELHGEEAVRVAEPAVEHASEQPTRARDAASIEQEEAAAEEAVFGISSPALRRSAR